MALAGKEARPPRPPHRRGEVTRGGAHVPPLRWSQPNVGVVAAGPAGPRARRAARRSTEGVGDASRARGAREAKWQGREPRAGQGPAPPPRIRGGAKTTTELFFYYNFLFFFCFLYIYYFFSSFFFGFVSAITVCNCFFFSSNLSFSAALTSISFFGKAFAFWASSFNSRFLKAAASLAFLMILIVYLLILVLVL
jgi:hypothetical protein